MRPTEQGQVVRRAMSVVLGGRVERGRWEGQREVSLLVDGVDAFGFRVGAMPVRTRVIVPVGGLNRNLHEEVGILILARSDDRNSFFINLLGPALRSVEPYSVQT